MLEIGDRVEVWVAPKLSECLDALHARQPVPTGQWVRGVVRGCDNVAGVALVRVVRDDGKNNHRTGDLVLPEEVRPIAVVDLLAEVADG